MNIYNLTDIIHATTREQRDRVFEEIHNLPIGDETFCRYYECKKEGECDIEISVGMRGPINKEIYDILNIPLKYPGVTEEEWSSSDYYPTGHRIYHKDYWEDIWTVEDELEFSYVNDIEFYPGILELQTFRKVYDNHGNLISEESKKEPYPIEKMPDYIRIGYEKWKEDPVKWEENKKREEERLEEEYRLKHPANNDDDDLPF